MAAFALTRSLRSLRSSEFCGVRLRRTLTACGTAKPPFGGSAGETPAPPAAAPPADLVGNITYLED
jgi:hypothetical protein